MFQAPGVHVVALVPVAGPVPPPIIVVIPEPMASSADRRARRPGRRERGATCERREHRGEDHRSQPAPTL